MKWAKLMLRWLLWALGAVLAVALLWATWHWGWRWYGQLPQQTGSPQIVVDDLWYFTDEVMAPCHARSLVHSQDGVRLVYMRSWDTSLMITMVPVSANEALIDISFVSEKSRFRHIRDRMPMREYQKIVDQLEQRGFGTALRRRHMLQTDAQEAVYLEVSQGGVFANWRAGIGNDPFGDEILKIMELIHPIDFMRAWWERAGMERLAHDHEPATEQPVSPPDLSP